MKNKRINVRHNNFISARMPVLISPRTRPHGHRHAGRSRRQAIIAKDIDRMEELGIYEVAPEDFAVAEFVDSSKLELQRIVREGLDYLRSEMS